MAQKSPLSPVVYPSTAGIVLETQTATPLSVLQRFRVLIRTSQRHSQWIEKQCGLSGAQLWALQEVQDAPGLRVGELAERMAMHQSTVSNLLEKLESAGLLRRGRSLSDQRVVRIYPTEAGSALLARAPTPTRGVLPEALRQLDPEMLERLQHDMEMLLGRVRELDEGSAHQPLPFTE